MNTEKQLRGFILTRFFIILIFTSIIEFAGFVYGLMKYGITHDMLEQGLSEAQWSAIVDEAQQFAANVCQSIHNSVDIAFGRSKAIG